LQQLDRFTSLFWIVLSAVIAIHSYRLGVGSLSDPGSGFIFFYTALFIALMAMILLVNSWTKKVEEEGARVFKNVDWLKVILPFSYILLYAFILEKAGFILATFLLVFFFLKTIEAKGWFVAMFAAGAASWGTYAMFELWLHVRLPRGVLGLL
jgi:putative tricarboxylic transport membrane protein